MIRLWPSSIVGRTVALLLLGLAISNLVGFSLYWTDRSRTLAATRANYAADRILSLTEIVEAMPAPSRQEFVRQFRGAGFRVVWTRDRALAGAEPFANPWVTALRDKLREQLGGKADDGLLIGRVDPTDRQLFESLTYQRDRTDRRMPSMGMDRTGPGMERGFRGGGRRFNHDFQPERAPGPIPDTFMAVSLRLGDGTWLNFLAPELNIPPFWRAGFFLPILAAILAVIAVTVWAVWRATAPLALFTRAAERLGRDVTAPPLEEKGPREVSRAAHAFNEMQIRLRSFIEDRTQMLAAISHDLRTPITRMRLRAEFVEDREQREKMLRDLEEMEAMIASTLSFAREDAANEERVQMDLADLLQSLCDEEADIGRSVAYDGVRRLPFHAAPLALKRAFSNLIDNAVKYGGSARVTLRESDRDVVVTVEDDGPGLPHDQTEKVFAAFYRVEGSRSRETGGVGLGLAVVRSIIRAHGGDVELANRSEGGLKAVVTLPRD